GETPEEIAGFVRTLRRMAIKVPNKRLAIDVCGTGGDRSGSFNISTAVAFLVSHLGVPVAKHGNRAASSNCGSIDVLEALGVSYQRDPEIVAKEIDEKGLSFIFAPYFHPVIGKVAKIRKEIGIGTIFNLIGPLLNPANLKAQLIGVFNEELLEKMAEVAKLLNMHRIIIVHGLRDHLDEVSISGPTKVAFVENSNIEYFIFNPQDVGLPTYTVEEIKGGSSRENAEIIRRVLRGEGTEAQRSVVLLNAAFALWVAREVESIEEGLKVAGGGLDIYLG
ncbi:MAG: anthranilate phosphoribosyltransferase, partial [bacterium]